MGTIGGIVFQLRGVEFHPLAPGFAGVDPGRAGGYGTESACVRGCQGGDRIAGFAESGHGGGSGRRGRGQFCDRSLGSALQIGGKALG